MAEPALNRQPAALDAGFAELLVQLRRSGQRQLSRAARCLMTKCYLGSHRNFIHPEVARPITISGSFGSDARQYQIRAVKSAIEESKK